MYTQDYDLIGRSLHDEIVENLCARFDSGFDLIKQTAMENGALGSGISGSGPSIFALSKGEATANAIAKAMSAVYDQMNCHTKFMFQSKSRRCE
jgi:homoserine kinase